MWKPLVKSSIAGGVIVFIWYMFSWIILPWHEDVTHRFTNQTAVAEVIMDNAPVDGVYILPSMKPPMVQPNQPMPNENPADLMNWKGPFVFANVVHLNMTENNMTRPVIMSFIINFIGAFIITGLVMQTKLQYWNRVWFVTIIGFLTGFLSLMPLWNWWGFTGYYVIVGILDMTIAWFLGGLAMARLSRK